MDDLMMIVRFLLVGGISYLTLVTVVFLLVEYLSVSLVLAYLLGYSISIPVHYLGNSKLTFRALALDTKLISKYITGLLCFFTVCVILEYLFSHLDPSLLKRILFVTAPSVAVSIVINWFWVFSDHK
ncbi:hypothetical protein NBRC116602_28930 [Hyphomicrobiales bacterium 4NK60-0047b]